MQLKKILIKKLHLTLEVIVRYKYLAFFCKMIIIKSRKWECLFFSSIFKIGCLNYKYRNKMVV